MRVSPRIGDGLLGDAQDLGSDAGRQSRGVLVEHEVHREARLGADGTHVGRQGLADARPDLGAQVEDRQAQLGDNARELIADALKACLGRGVRLRGERIVDEETKAGDLLGDAVVDLTRKATALLQGGEIAHLVEDARGVQAQRGLVGHRLRLGEVFYRPESPCTLDTHKADALVTETERDDGAGARGSEFGTVHGAEALDGDARLPRLAPEPGAQRGGPAGCFVGTAGDGEQPTAVGAHDDLGAVMGEHAAKASECCLGQCGLLETAGQLTCHVAQGHEQAPGGVVVGACGGDAFSQMRGEDGAEPERDAQGDDDDEVDDTCRQVITHAQHGPHGEDEGFDCDG